MLAIAAMPTLAEAQEKQPDYSQPSLLLTSRTKGFWTRQQDLETLQAELDQAVAAGYRIAHVLPAVGGHLQLELVKSETPPPEGFAYLLLRAGSAEKLEPQVCDAAERGFRLRPHSLMIIDGRDYALVMEKVGPSPNSCPYRLLETGRTSTLEAEINELAREGFELAALKSTGSHLAIMQKIPGETERGGAEQEASRYLLVAASRTSTLQKELTEAAAKGYRIRRGAATGLEGAVGGEGMFLLEKSRPGEATPEYLLVADRKVEKLQAELNEAASKGFRLLPSTIMAKPHYFWGGQSIEIVCVMEKTPGAASSFEYLVLKEEKLERMREEIARAAENGYRAVSTDVAVIMERSR
ncbi:MAG: hypothetical protein GWN58_53680 [Anaerolineae bacterium]|nr:hypothetical protein [Anaerolineae bacterium]